MLAAIQKQLVTNEVLTESLLAKKTNVSIDALTPMVNLLVKRGVVEKVTSGDCSGGCGCSATATIAYRWLGEAKKRVPLNILAV
ncbi:MAG: hypothetical protein COB35_03020 [Gammaproteobacteria bacterium]|nr:MAG: hypothetical protein COB35_03020 [Gammaproteobacteria bacterium]